MFVQLPKSKSLIDLRTVKRVRSYEAGRTSWELTLDIGSIMQPDLIYVYIDHADYDYLWSQLSQHIGAN